MVSKRKRDLIISIKKKDIHFQNESDSTSRGKDAFSSERSSKEQKEVEESKRRERKKTRTQTKKVKVTKRDKAKAKIKFENENFVSGSYYFGGMNIVEVKANCSDADYTMLKFYRISQEFDRKSKVSYSVPIMYLNDLIKALNKIRNNYNPYLSLSSVSVCQ